MSSKNDAIEENYLSESGNQFLFKEEEFEEQEFDPSAFVARYRRVTSLESLREQLQSYSLHVQKQLYAIINRDYKDFITIATKLDGLDTRADMMVKPLFSLQIDLSSLQTGISGSLHIIKDKIDQQRQLSLRKSLIQKVLRINNQLDLAKTALNLPTSTHPPKGPTASLASTGAPNSAPSHASSNQTATADTMSIFTKRNKMYRRYNLHNTNNNTINNTTTNTIYSIKVDQDVFVCSEYERAAMALKEVAEDLTSVLSSLSSSTSTSITNTGTTNNNNNNSNLINVSMVQGLQSRYLELKSHLLQQCKAYLENYYSSSTTTSTSSTTSSTSTSSSTTNVAADSASLGAEGSINNNNQNNNHSVYLRRYLHCLRALHCLSSGHFAEEAFYLSVFLPYLKAHFIAGKIDGEAGRESFSGLPKILSVTIAYITNASKKQLNSSSNSCSSLGELIWQSEVLAYQMMVASSNSSSSLIPSMSILYTAIYRPIIQLLLYERYPQLTSLAIPSIYSMVYRLLGQDLWISLVKAIYPYDIADGGGGIEGESMEDRGEATQVYQWLVSYIVEDTGLPAHLLTLDNKDNSSLIKTKKAATGAGIPWQHEVYYQVRYREVMQRLEKVCECSYRTMISSHLSSSTGMSKSKAPTGTAKTTTGAATVSKEEMIGYIYQPLATITAMTTATSAAPSYASAVTSTAAAGTGGTPAKGAAVSAASASVPASTIEVRSKAGLIVSLSSPAMQTLLANNSGNLVDTFFAYDLYVPWLLEYSIIFSASSEFALKPLLKSFLMLYMKACQRLVIHLLMILHIYPVHVASLVSLVGGSGSGSESDYESYRLTYLTQYCSEGSSSSVGYVCSLDDYLHHLFDGYTFIQELTQRLTKTLIACTAAKASATTAASTAASITVDRLIMHTITPHRHLLTCLWQKITADLLVDCKRSLLAHVKSIAGKYRMTNKPAPTIASPYVSSILEPIEKMLAAYEHGKMKKQSQKQAGCLLKEIASYIMTTITESVGTDCYYQWKLQMIEEITLTYQEQIQHLLETVKQMDTALQRRARGGPGPGAGAGAGPGATGGAMTDSEKIYLQVKLDFQEYGGYVKKMLHSEVKKEEKEDCLLQIKSYQNILTMLSS